MIRPPMPEPRYEITEVLFLVDDSESLMCRLLA